MKGDSVFGSRDWRDIALETDPATKKQRLVDIYREGLGDAGFPFTLVFELVGGKGQELLLIFGTQRIEGVTKMKDAMWAVDPDGGSSFRNPKDRLQGMLDFGGTPQLELLERQIVERLESAGGETNLADLKDWVLTETLYKRSQCGDAVRLLVDDEKLEKSVGRADKDKIVRPTPPTLFDV